MTEDAFDYRCSRNFQDALAVLGVKHILIKPRHPWQNGKAEPFNRTLQEGWAYRQPFTSTKPGPTPCSHGNLTTALQWPRRLNQSEFLYGLCHYVEASPKELKASATADA
ncbi:integrase core domain-containing protein [Arthrobacter sp. 2MCAF14]|uniref:integrase core domain-containing protein n=1 Tax=Arthrobacter sp. 2MCAF14 TaxID=3232982 RepID=UPI003F9343A9